jgi:hypothetical protein
MRHRFTKIKRLVLPICLSCCLIVIAGCDFKSSSTEKGQMVFKVTTQGCEQETKDIASPDRERDKKINDAIHDYFIGFLIALPGLIILLFSKHNVKLRVACL